MTPFERLVASDPSRDIGYAPRDLDAMLARVVAQPYARVLSWRAFKARVLAGFTTSCAVMAAATYALAGVGPPLVRLTFAAAPAPMAAPAPTYATSQKVTVTGSGFVASAPTLLARRISTTVPSLATFTVMAPPSERDAVATLARALGVTLGTPRAIVVAPPGAHEWTARGVGGTEAFFARVGGVDLWLYGPVLSAGMPSAPAEATSLGGLSKAEISQRALAIVHALGTFDTGVPVVGGGAAFVRGAPTTVVVPILIDGHWSNLSDTVMLDARGRVISARGAMFSLGPPTSYPLISPRAAASHVGEQAAIFAHGLTPLGWPGYESSGAALPTGTLRLSQSIAQYRILVDAHGVGHALPIYQYVGRSNGSREVVLDALAINPRYLVYEVHGNPTQ